MIVCELLVGERGEREGEKVERERERERERDYVM